MSNTVARFILYNAAYINCKCTAGFQKLTQTWAEHAPDYMVARQYAARNSDATRDEERVAFYEERVHMPGEKVIPFPAEADGFAGFKVVEPDVKWTVYAGESAILRGTSEESGLFGARHHSAKVQDRFDTTENMRDPSIPGIRVILMDDGKVRGEQYIPNSLRNLRLEMDKESDVKFFCFMMGSEEDRKIMQQGPEEIRLGQLDYCDTIRFKK